MGDSDLSAEILLLQWTYSMLGNPLQLDSKKLLRPVGLTKVGINQPTGLNDFDKSRTKSARIAV